jgi:hypothetical protein
MSRLLLGVALVAILMLAGAAIIQAQDTTAPPADTTGGKVGKGGKGGPGGGGKGGPGGGGRGAPVTMNPDQQKIVDVAVPAILKSIQDLQDSLVKAGLDAPSARRAVMGAIMQAMRPAGGPATTPTPTSKDASGSTN